MKTKRIAALLLSLTLLGALLLPCAPLPLAAKAAGTAYTHYGNQLSAGAKVFYNALVGMAADGSLQTGSTDLDLTDSLLDQDTVQRYVDGTLDLDGDFWAARDAFYADYPSVFYVNYSYLSYRVTMESDGEDATYHLYIGTGRSDSYANGTVEEKALAAMLKNYSAALDKAVANADQGETVVEKITRAHDYLTGHVSYTLNYKDPYISTAYGALVNGQALCEGYARAFKAIMDALDIPCVLVSGVYRQTENRMEAHMWAEVQVDKTWYAVDVTMDDPVPVSGSGAGGKDGCENQAYLLVGATAMNVHHGSDGSFSPEGPIFTVPALAPDNYGFTRTEYTNGLNVAYSGNGKLEDVDAGEFHIDFRGMNYADAAKAGYWMLDRTFEVDPKTGEWIATDWAYIEPQYYSNEGLKDEATYLKMLLPQVHYVEFGVTDIPPTPFVNDGNSLPDLFYHGDPLLLVAATGMLENEVGTYVAPPYVKSTTPLQTGAMESGRTYQMEIVYNAILVDADGQRVSTVVMDASSQHYLGWQFVESAAASRSTISRATVDYDDAANTTTLQFSFTPSQMYMDNSVFYRLRPAGLVGEISQKQPNEAVFGVSNLAVTGCGLPFGVRWNVYGKPSLLGSGDLSMQGWEPADELGDFLELTDRLMLVTSRPPYGQNTELEDLLATEEGVTPLAMETYNINLTLCKCMVLNTGDGVRVMLGFPEGYGPDDAGVTFKAYHYIHNAQNEITGIEEIPCTITPYGLVLVIKSFSPFALVAVEDDGADTDKTVIVTAGEGGSIEITAPQDSQFGMVTVKQDGTATVTVTADKGYRIDSITVGDALLPDVAGESSYTVELAMEDYETLRAVIVDAQFVTETTLAAEEANGETAILPQAPKAVIEMPADVTVQEGDELTLTPTVTLPGGEVMTTYQWYKDDEALPTQTGANLTVEAAELADAGAYRLQVTTRQNGLASTVDSDSVTVTVTAAATPEPTAEPTAEPTPEGTTPPSAKPTARPTAPPTAQPTPVPTAPPAPAATPAPTAKPSGSGSGSSKATPSPTPSATPEPTPTPQAPEAAIQPTPTPQATQLPTLPPTQAPTPAPTEGNGLHMAWWMWALLAVVVLGGASLVVFLLFPRRSHHKPQH